MSAAGGDATPNHVCNTAVTACTFGMTPGMLTVLPLHRTLTLSQPAANIMDHMPLMNVMPFGMCSSPANPTVAAATSAALGVLTPMPCIPATPAPWALGATTVILDSAPALDDVSKLNCTWGGVISSTFAGQVTETIP